MEENLTKIARPAILAAVVCAVCGCRSTSVAPPFIGTAAPRQSEGAVDAEGAAPPADLAATPAAAEAANDRGENSSRRQAGQVRPVAFQPPAAEEPAGSSQPSTEDIPAPLPDDFPRSDLKLADFEGIALQRNPAMAQATAEVDAAQGAWLQAGLLPNPVVGYSGQQIGAGGRAEQQGIYLQQEVITAKKLRLSRQAASWRIEQAQRTLASTRLRVLTDVRIGFYDVLIAQRRRDVARQLVTLSERAVEAAEALFQAEEVSRADPLRARIEADRARITLQTAENQYYQAWRRLVAVSGLPELAPARLEGELTPDALELSWEESLARVLTQSPELAAALANVEAARWAVERARAEAVPNIDIQAIVQDDRGIGGNDGNLQLSIPVPIWNRNQGGVREARAQAVSAAQAVDRLALDLQSRLAVAFQRYASARNQVDKYSRKDGILENSQRTLELVRAGYAAEEFDLLNLIAAQRTYFQTNLAYFDSLRELWSSAMEIEGLLLTGSLPQ